MMVFGSMTQVYLAGCFVSIGMEDRKAQLTTAKNISSTCRLMGGMNIASQSRHFSNSLVNVYAVYMLCHT